MTWGAAPRLAVWLGLLVACGDSGKTGLPDASPDSGGDTQTEFDASADSNVADCSDGPLQAPVADCAPVLAPSSGDPQKDCVDRINQFREQCQCLPPLARWTEGEDCADAHAEYDVSHGAHAGFSGNICSPSGMAQNECPGWGSLNEVLGSCLQTMWNEGPGEDFQQHGHYRNMSSTNSVKVACGFFTTPEGAVWAVQNFSP